MKDNISLRDQFAMAALSTINYETFAFHEIASEVYSIADAMMKEREKGIDITTLYDYI